MALGVSLQDISRFVTIAPDKPTGRSAPGVARVEPFRDLTALRQLQRQLVEVFDGVARLDRAVNGSSELDLGRPIARSLSELGLNLVPTTATLESTEEVNATPTFFAPRGPAWTNGSSALLTIDGAYDGSNGDGLLSFEVRRAGVHGQDRLRIRVRDPANNIITNVTLRSNHAIDREYSLGNGLILTLGEGSLINRDRAYVFASSSFGSYLNSALPLNGVRNLSPNLQYGLPPITDGSVEVNGESIAVSESDSLQSILTRINNSNADVTAYYNQSTERVEFTQRNSGSAPTIEINNDTANFSQNFKLATASVTPGIDADPDRAIADVARFAGARSGDLVINGESISVDVRADTLNDVIARINASQAGVVARFDAQTQRVELESNDERRELSLLDNDAGLLAAFDLPEGRVRSENLDGPAARRYRNRVGDAVDEIAAGLNAVFSDRNQAAADDPLVRELRRQIEAVVARFLGDDANRDTGIGLAFRSTDAAAVSGKYASVDRRKLATLLRNGSSSVGRFFNGSRQAGGFINELGAAVQQAVQTVAGTLGTKGSVIDTRA